MKTNGIFKNGLVICILVSIFACDTSSDDFNNHSQSEDFLINNDAWMVSWFWDKDKDETSDFFGYTFNFLENGQLLAKKEDNVVYTGQWSHDISSNKLVLQMGNIKPLEELTDDWIIRIINNEIVELKDDNDEHLEELHFIKR